jgi:trimethylamine--corrinoid protein Co-methyltransferase
MARNRTPGRKGRPVDYIHLTHPFTPQAVFTDDAIAALHDAALGLLEREGMKILLPEARTLFAAAGARVTDDMVCIGRDIVAAALKTAPRQWQMRSVNPARERLYAPGQLLFGPGAGCPNATDLQRGRRPGTLRDYEETLALQQSFDVIHILGPSVEPQDVPANLRHYAMMQAQICRADKPMFVYARGRAQVQDSLQMICLGLNLSDDDWANGVWAYTVINTNSPRQLDNPMAQGIIDFARAGQASIITPFCLAGAMAPVTVAGALILQHAEALAGITLAQLARPGAPVSYGGFSSNVDMKSGAPAFGTPEHLKMQIGSGQLARHIGLPWRSASGSASNTADMQAAQETTHTLWGAMMAQATLVVHAAGWLEGGLSFGYEKFINDIEALQTLAEMCVRPGDTLEDFALDALAEVPPGGHFFATAHTMARYDAAFYPPLVADLSNPGQWTEAGALR